MAGHPGLRSTGLPQTMDCPQRFDFAMTGQTSFFRFGLSMQPLHAKPLQVMLLAIFVIALPGCRAIRRFGESRQTIAARRLSGQGFQAMHDGRWDVAENLFSDALSVSKSDDRAHWGLAESFWERGERELAIKQIEQAVRLSAGDPKLVQRAGRMYLEVGRLDEADQHSQWALRLQRDSEEAWALRGDCLRAAGEDKEALAAYHRALALRPDYVEVQLQAAEIYRAGRRFDRVLATLDRLQDGIGIEEAPPRVDMLQGIAMRRLGRSEEAHGCFVRAARKDPSDPAPHLEIASLALEQDDAESARQSIAMVKRLDPNSPAESTILQQLVDQQQRVARETSVRDTSEINQRR